MSIPCRGITHCSECGKSLSPYELGICDYCREKAEKNTKPKKQNITTHHVTISTEKLKELIKKNYKWNDYTLQGKIDIVTSLAYFDNDKELLEFLRYMED